MALNPLNSSSLEQLALKGLTLQLSAKCSCAIRGV